MVSGIMAWKGQPGELAGKKRRHLLFWSAPDGEWRGRGRVGMLAFGESVLLGDAMPATCGDAGHPPDGAWWGAR